MEDTKLLGFMDKVRENEHIKPPTQKEIFIGLTEKSGKGQQGKKHKPLRPKKVKLNY